MSTETLPLLIDADVRARLERAAAQAGHNAGDLAGAVLREFLDENDHIAALIQEGIDDADAGKLIDFEIVKADIEAKLAELLAKK